jgi:hypothetical protein
MKKLFAFIILLAWGSYAVNAQPLNRLQRILTDPLGGKKTEFQPGNPGTSDPVIADGKAAPMSGVNWQATDPASIANYVKVSTQSQKTFNAWGLNNQRISFYGNTNSPIWEVSCPISAWDEIVDMTDDGTRMVNGYNSLVEVYEPGSSTPVWSTTISNSVRGVQIPDDGQKVFVAASDLVTQDSSFIYCFNVGQNVPAWTKSFAGNFTALVVSKSGNRLLVAEYGGGANKLFVLDPADGSLIFETAYNDQYSPAVSYDGKYIVSGDFSGHLFLLEYNTVTSTYSEKWNATVNGSNSWVCGMGISADGSTIAVGTLIFTTSGGYDGELYVFNNYSPVPVWIYQNMGDMVQCVDVSDDGSIIAAAGWGPMGNSVPDFFLFRKQSNEPYLTVNSPGSLFCLDLSPDGKLCATGGKAVHARDFGNGGKLYNINSDPGGGTLGGIAVKSGATQQAGVKIEILGLNTYFTYSDDSSAYVLKYIPAGTYTARYSAVGYYPQDITGVVIAAGQTATVDVILLPTGEPPQNLTATQGAGLAVGLSWQPSEAPGVTGYNIYRKQYSFDFYPPAPIGTAAAGQLSYSDTTALPLIHYYYAVTAQLPGNLQTPYSNDAIGWISTGFITDSISAYPGSTPVIDGTISPGEWSDAFRTDISNFFGQRDNTPRPIGSVTGYFKVNPEKTALYVAVDNTVDAVFEDHDEVALYVDDNNDGVFPSPGDDSEGNYWAAHYASGDVIKYRPIYGNGGVGTVVFLPNPQIKASNATGHLVYEFVIPLGTDSTWQIAFNSQDQSGIFIFVLDDPVDYNGWWPCTNQNIFTAEGYGVITFGAEDLVPPPPMNLQLDNPVAQNILLHWDQPGINDFDHFNIYWSMDGGSSYTKLDTTIGVQYYYTVPANGIYYFYVTTVDQAGQESVPSNIVETNVVIGMEDFLQAGEISMIRLGPNPFRHQLGIDLRLDRPTRLEAKIVDLFGNSICTFYESGIGAGSYHLAWNGKDHSGNEAGPGVYMVRFRTAGGSIQTFKVVKL